MDKLILFYNATENFVNKIFLSECDNLQFFFSQNFKFFLLFIKKEVKISFWVLFSSFVMQSL